MLNVKDHDNKNTKRLNKIWLKLGQTGLGQKKGSIKMSREYDIFVAICGYT